MSIVDLLFLLFTVPVVITIGILILALPMAGLIYVWRATYPYWLIIGRWGADTRNFIPFISISFLLVIFFLLISLFFLPFLVIVVLSLIVIAFPTVPTLAVWIVRASRRYGPVVRDKFWIFLPAAKRKVLEVRNKAEDSVGSAMERGKSLETYKNGFSSAKNGFGSVKENGFGAVKKNGFDTAKENGKPQDIKNKLKNSVGSAKGYVKSLGITENLKKRSDAALSGFKAGYTWLVGYTRKSGSSLLHLLHLK